MPLDPTDFCDPDDRTPITELPEHVRIAAERQDRAQAANLILAQEANEQLRAELAALKKERDQLRVERAKLALQLEAERRARRR